MTLLKTDFDFLLVHYFLGVMITRNSMLLKKGEIINKETIKFWNCALTDERFPSFSLGAPVRISEPIKNN